MFNNAGRWWVAGYRHATPDSQICPQPRATYRVGQDSLVNARLRSPMYNRYWEVIAEVENGGGLYLRVSARSGQVVEIK